MVKILPWEKKGGCHGEFSSSNGAVFSSIQNYVFLILKRVAFRLKQPLSPSLEHVHLVKSTAVTVISFLVCTDGSIDQHSHNLAETPSDLA